MAVEEECIALLSVQTIGTGSLPCKGFNTWDNDMVDAQYLAYLKQSQA
jgi:hypothetical protein